MTLVRDDALLYFRDCRHHQAIHIGRRRRTIYLPELLFQKAEEKGYDYWAIAEGIIYAGWMLLDYLLLVDILRSYSGEVDSVGGFKLSEPYVRGYAREHNRHRRFHPEKAKSEVEEFVDGYRSALIRIEPVNAMSDEPFQLARRVFDAEIEQRWARSKMERIADLFEYPRLFLFDRDIIHGAALQLAHDKKQSIEPSCFADVLHDYRDALRFNPAPLMTTFCKGVVPKPRAIFIMEVVRLGSKGLTGFFAAYRAGELDIVDLVHPLWMYLCSLSSDPAGVFARVGRCRALARRIDGEEEKWDQDQLDDLQRAVIGILVRLDRSTRYKQLAAEVLDQGELARNELLQVIGLHRLREKDEWATFRMKKQAIVECVCNLLDRFESADAVTGGRAAARTLDERREVHEDAELVRVLEDNPHRHTSDPSAVLMFVRSYKRTLAEFGPSDPDTNHLLTSILIRLDRLDSYRRLVKQVLRLGPPAISALNEVLELIPERDEKRRGILQKARETLGHIMIERQLRSTAKEKAAASRRRSGGSDDGDGPSGAGNVQFVPLQRMSWPPAGTCPAAIDRGMARLVSAALILTLLTLSGCVGIFHRSPSTRAVVPAVKEVAAAIVTGGNRPGDIAVFGFRDDDGERTANTQALDEFLLAALLNAGAPIAAGVGVVAEDEGESKEWKKAAILPDDWKETESPYLLSGQLHSRGPWIYATILLTDRESGTMINSWRYRFSEREIERHGRQLVKRRGTEVFATAEVVAPIEVDLHIVARHSESGFVEWFEPVEGGTLQPGDRLQLRYRVRTDCTVYAVLYESDGGSEVILESQVAYPGRLYFTPGEEQWIRVQENEVYTLYFIAAAGLEEDTTDLFDSMSELVRRGQIDRFEGLTLLDAAVVEFLSRSQTEAVAVVRGGEVARGKSESFTYNDGETFESTPQLLSASPVLLRALSFEVQYK